MIYSLAPSEHIDTGKTWPVYTVRLRALGHAYVVWLKYGVCNIKGTTWSQAIIYCMYMCKIILCMCSHYRYLCLHLIIVLVWGICCSVCSTLVINHFTKKLWEPNRKQRKQKQSEVLLITSTCVIHDRTLSLAL